LQDVRRRRPRHKEIAKLLRIIRALRRQQRLGRLRGALAAGADEHHRQRLVLGQLRSDLEAADGNVARTDDVASREFARLAAHHPEIVA